MKTSFGTAGLIRRAIPSAALLIGALIALCCRPGVATAQTKAAPARAQASAEHSQKTDLKHQPTLYLVGYAHLDTQWRWEYPQVISEYLPDTMHKNFALFQKYPHYIFNWTGANRYMMMKEYYPADFAKLKHYVATGQWFPAGSSMEENDVNSPSPESIIRQVLYGNEYFRHEFGKASEEYMLPDCFGFPADLPSILAAAGIKGFSTQKLTWGSSAPVGGPDSAEQTPAGTPFNVGVWTGPDGRSIIAALNPESYSGGVSYDLTKSTRPSDVRNFIDWPKRVDLDGKVSGVFADYHYYGTGDIGGSPDENSVRLVEEMVTKSMGALPSRNPNQDDDNENASTPPTGPQVRMGTGPLHIISSDADQMFKDILAQHLTAGLPRYQGDLELTNHSAGSLTSEAVHKRWNRENENLAHAAEEASVGAVWLGGRPYPLERLNHAWRLVLGGQFHDIMAGTATPKSYEYSWNDDVIAMNQFAGVLSSATEALASQLDTQGKGAAIVVFNPLSIEREDVVEANVEFDDGSAQCNVRVVGPDGREVPSEVEACSSMGRSSTIKMLFLAKVLSTAFAVYDVQPSATAPSPSSELKVTNSSLENARYRIQLNHDGDVSSIFDKKLNRELLSAPARLAFQTEKPSQWPAWNMDWSDQSKPPRGYVGGPAKITIAERGPVRVALRIEREAEGSKFVQTIRLSSGDAGNRIEFVNSIDWKTREAALKATFPLTASNQTATYNWGAGTIERPADNEKMFEMPSHRWFDLTDQSGKFGVTILSGAKTGSDRPSDNALRLTLLYTPGVSDAGQSYRDQGSQDFGHHEFLYGLSSHEGGWRDGDTPWQAYCLDSPLIAFESAKHSGALGKTLSLLKVSESGVRVMAFKKAEDGTDEVVRLVEMNGKPQRDVRVSFAAPVITAREINGQELPVGPVSIAGGDLIANFAPYEIKSYEVKLAPARVRSMPTRWQIVPLHYDLAAASKDGEKAAGGFDAAGNALPAELLPSEIAYSGIHFKLAPPATGKPDAVIARGQTIHLPAGKFNRVYLLAASADGDQQATFKVGDTSTDLTIQNWGGYIGQSYDRSFTMEPRPIPPEPDASDTSQRAQRIRRRIAYLQKNPETLPHFAGITPGFIKRAPIAWFASHHHTSGGANVPYAYSYLFAYALELPAGAKTLQLPDNDKIRILAITVSDEPAETHPAQRLYDTTEQVAGSQ
ncbi:MAG TPA: glycoside hydrolase family 38 C-terminal domain-containing protein [Candidatus Acidoferrales bacterium]|nr:glycoside hydrolase family 38 C-terminal domain-containing protein [Candidatus Acidoferrales bacterium]